MNDRLAAPILGPATSAVGPEVDPQASVCSDISSASIAGHAFPVLRDDFIEIR
jgi:hypothetical protein